MNTFNLKSTVPINITRAEVSGLSALAKSSADSSIEALLNVDYIYRDDHETITEKYGDVLTSTRDLEEITFNDDEIRDIFVKHSNIYPNRFSDKEAEEFTELPERCLNNNRIYSFDEISQFPNLDSLNISGDINITELDLQDTNVNKLNFNKCSGLRKVYLPNKEITIDTGGLDSVDTLLKVIYDCDEIINFEDIDLSNSMASLYVKNDNIQDYLLRYNNIEKNLESIDDVDCNSLLFDDGTIIRFDNNLTILRK